MNLPYAVLQHISDKCEAGLRKPELVSPDGRYRLEIEEELCGAPGSQDIWTVKITDLLATNSALETVFGTYDNAPEVSWRNAQKILISVDTVQKIIISFHKIGAVSVDYTLGPHLSNGGIEAMKRGELQWIQQYRSGYIKELSSRTVERYDSFSAWAKENVR